MGLAIEGQKYFTVEEYLEYEEHSEFRHEYYQGELFAMAGGTTNHNRLVNPWSFYCRTDFFTSWM